MSAPDIGLRIYVASGLDGVIHISVENTAADRRIASAIVRRGISQVLFYPGMHLLKKPSLQVRYRHVRQH
jgi:hypothetical protein